MGLYFSGLKTSSGSMDVHRGCITRSITGNRRGSVWPMRPSVMNSGLRGESAVRCLCDEAGRSKLHRSRTRRHVTGCLALK